MRRVKQRWRRRFGGFERERSRVLGITLCYLTNFGPMLTQEGEYGGVCEEDLGGVGED